MDTVLKSAAFIGAGFVIYKLLQKSGLLGENVTNQEAQSIWTNYGNKTGKIIGGKLTPNNINIIQSEYIDGKAYNVTYSLSEKEYNLLTPFQKLQIKIGVPLKRIFG